MLNMLKNNNNNNNNRQNTKLRSRRIKALTSLVTSNDYATCSETYAPPPPLPLPTSANNFDLDIAIDLMQLCVYTYVQYQNDDTWTIPAPYKIKQKFYVYEIQNDNISKEVPFGFIATKDDNKDIYVCFRGTRGAPEWKNDATIELVPCSFLSGQDIKVHKGFQDEYTVNNDFKGSLQKQVLDYLNSLPNFPSSYDNLWVTGHSLGAALATLAVADIVNNTIHTGAKMYNFGSPLVGNQSFVDFFKSKIGTSNCNTANNSLDNSCSWRVVNINDAVPTIPPPRLGYVHVDGCSGPYVCNNVNNDNKNNGLFEINFADKCDDLFTDVVCFGNAHKADNYLIKLKSIQSMSTK